MGNDKITFITATWNVVQAGRVEALRRCLRSVAACPFPVEHIVVDGGSTDGTVEEIKNEERRVKNSGGACCLRWISERDRGIYDALNKGVRMAKGEWICVLGCDDWVCDPVKLWGLLESVGRREEVELIVTPVEKDGGAGRVNMKSCLYSIPYCHQGLLARRSVFGKVGGFDVKYGLLADYKFTLNCVLKNLRHEIVNEAFAHYSTGGASSNWEKSFAEGAAIMRETFGLTDAEEDRARCLHVLPARVCLKYLMHPNWFARQSAAYSLVKTLFKR